MPVSAVIVLVVAVAVVVALNATDDDENETAATEDSTSTTDAVTTTEPPTTSTTQPPDTDPLGEEFTDPEGVYLMNVDPEWVPNHESVLQAMEMWMVGQASGDRSNLSLLTALDGGGDLDTYMDGLIQGVGRTTDDLDEAGRDVVEGAVGQELGLLELTGTQANQDLHFLIVLIMDGRTVVAATLTSTPENFADTRAAVEPYLFTLQFLE